MPHYRGPGLKAESHLIPHHSPPCTILLNAISMSIKLKLNVDSKLGYY